MSTMQSESAEDFIDALARRIAARTLSLVGKDKKSTPSSKKLIEKSLLKIPDSDLKVALQSHVEYFERLLDLSVEQYIADASGEFGGCECPANVLCLTSPKLHFKDTLALSKTNRQAFVESLICSVQHTPGCTPQQVATALLSAAEWPFDSSTRLVQLLLTRLAMQHDEWSQSAAACDSTSFLLAFAACHACRSSVSCASNACWSVATMRYQDISCFSYIGHISYWMLRFAVRGTACTPENALIACKQLLALLTSARKHSEHLVGDADDCAAPIACLLTQHWLQSVTSVADAPESKFILREIYSFMRQWEGGDKLSLLWSRLAVACGLEAEIHADLLSAGASRGAGRYVQLAAWFIDQEVLVSGAMRFVEVSVGVKKSQGRDAGDDDMDFNDEIEIVLDGKAAGNESGSGDEDEDEEDGQEGKVRMLGDDDDASDRDDDELPPVTFFLDKKGDALRDDDDISNNQIIADLGDLGEKSSGSSKTRKSKGKKRKVSLSAINEEDSATEEVHSAPQRKTHDTIAVSSEEDEEDQRERKATKRSARAARASARH